MTESFCSSSNIDCNGCILVVLETKRLHPHGLAPQYTDPIPTYVPIHMCKWAPIIQMDCQNKISLQNYANEYYILTDIP